MYSDRACTNACKYMCANESEIEYDVHRRIEYVLYDALFYVRTECTLGYYIQKYMSNGSYFFPCFMVDCCILNIQEDTNACRILIGLTDLIGLEDVRTMVEPRTV